LSYIIVIPLLFAFLWILWYGLIRKPKPLLDSNQPFPENWRKILNERVWYFKALSEDRKPEFEHRILLFLSEKKVNGIDTEITELDKLLVASSAIIPLFNFPYYNYPRLKEINIYPSSFDNKFQTHESVKDRDTLGMIGDGFLNGVVLLSKPDLERAFNGKRQRSNVGIHEFVHLIDKADGAVDGIPDVLFDHSYSLPWLKEAKREAQKEKARIRSGKSDINPYALTNDAEFLAVVSEYFFDNPVKMKKVHPKLYAYLAKVYKKDVQKL
jgi:Mlc titration factor MtfA (ptsG expression regulator)